VGEEESGRVVRGGYNFTLTVDRKAKALNAFSSKALLFFRIILITKNDVPANTKLIRLG